MLLRLCGPERLAPAVDLAEPEMCKRERRVERHRLLERGSGTVPLRATVELLTAQVRLDRRYRLRRDRGNAQRRQRQTRAPDVLHQLDTELVHQREHAVRPAALLRARDRRPGLDREQLRRDADLVAGRDDTADEDCARADVAADAQLALEVE